MTRMDALRQTATPLDRFLQASVGDDCNGIPVTVLSTFARLGLDPWEEASDLSSLTREKARLRLGSLLARFRDVAASGSGSSVQRLLDLLPQPAPQNMRARVLTSSTGGSLGLGPILAIGAALLLVLQAVLRNFGGPEN